MLTRLSLATVLVLSACASSQSPPPPAAAPVATPVAAPDDDAPPDEVAPAPTPPDEIAPAPVSFDPGSRQLGESCVDGSDCASGMCEGLGCGTPDGVCVDHTRRCKKDLRAYCGCDGETFRASSNCQGRRFAHGGPCARSIPDREELTAPAKPDTPR